MYEFPADAERDSVRYFLKHANVVAPDAEGFVEAWVDYWWRSGAHPRLLMDDALGRFVRFGKIEDRRQK